MNVNTNPQLAAYVADLKAEQAKVLDEMSAADVVRFDGTAKPSARKNALERVRQAAAKLEGLEFALGALEDNGIWGVS